MNGPDLAGDVVTEPRSAGLAHASSFSMTQMRDLGFIIAAIVSWLMFITGLWERQWRLDFQYFWFAAVQWVRGVSPYDQDYVAAGQLAVAPDFGNPFFYPPAILPIIAPFGLMPLRVAAVAALIVNFLLMAAIAVLLARALARRLQNPPPTTTLRAAVFAGLSILAVPFQHVIGYGQVTLLLLLGAAMILTAIDEQRRWLGAAGLALVLCKPHFGLPLLVLFAANSQFRAMALRSLVLYAGLSLLGAVHDPVGTLQGFLANVSTYQDKPGNEAAFSQGAPYLAGLFGLGLSPILGLGLACGLAAAMNSFVAARPSSMISGVIAAGIALTPSHATDLVLMAVAIPAIAEFSTVKAKLAAAAALAILAQATSIAPKLARAFDPRLQLEWLAMAHTAGLILLMATLFAAAWRITRASGSEP